MTIQEAFWSGVVIGSIVMAAINVLVVSRINAERVRQNARPSSLPAVRR